MKYLLALILFLSTSAVSNTPIDSSAHSFSMRQQNKRVDRFDFSGEFPNLEDIDIDARKKKCVEFDLSGDFPLLTSVNFEGGFGELKGNLTGNYPCLTLVNLLCSSCAMKLDLRGKWEKSCQINIRGLKEDVTIVLPEDVGLVINTKISPSGKVCPKEGLKKQGWFSILNKTYKNELARTAEIVLTLDIEISDGKIILN